MSGRTVTVTLWLPDREVGALNRRVSEMRSAALRQQMAPDWSEEDELRSLLMLSLFRLRQMYELRDKRRVHAEEIRQISAIDVPDWIRDLELAED